ncbi:hypothetical protein PMAYCL1PPCAC_24904, partial [Pristionchus mayeri]
SAPFRRVITTKRNHLPQLYSEVVSITTGTSALGNSASNKQYFDLHSQATRLRGKLVGALKVIKDTAQEWQTALEDIDDVDTNEHETDVLVTYFTDTTTESKSIAAIEGDIEEQLADLDSEIAILDRLLTASSSTTKDLGDATKLRYLESALEGRALDLFTHLRKRGTSYAAIISRFQTEYGQDEFASMLTSNPYSGPPSRQSEERPVTTTVTSDRIRMLTGSTKLLNPSNGREEDAEVFLDCGAAVTLISETKRIALGLRTLRKESLDLTGVGGRSDGTKEYDIVSVTVPSLKGNLQMEAIVFPEPLTSELPQARLSRADKRVLRKMDVCLAQPIDSDRRVTPHLLIGGTSFYEVTGIASSRLPSGLLTVPTA